MFHAKRLTDFTINTELMLSIVMVYRHNKPALWPITASVLLWLFYMLLIIDIDND